MELVIQNISKTYRNGVQALKDVSLNIPTGMFGLLGPNGSGKSTLMRSIATLQGVDQGSIQLGNIDVLQQREDVRRLLGYMPQDFGVYPGVDPLSLLNHFAVLKGLTDRHQRHETVERLLHLTNLWDARKKKLGGFSGGMKRRFGIAQALLGSPKLIIVDEPTAGLDPEERNRFLNLLSEIGEQVVVILSTHIVDDVSDLCTTMAIIEEGQVLYTGRPADAVARIHGKTWQKTIAREELKTYQEQAMVISTRLVGGRSVIHVYSESEPVGGFESATPDLQDFYFTTLKQNGNGRI
jgi:ABC-2 type transport system ATP-binding protein